MIIESLVSGLKLREVERYLYLNGWNVKGRIWANTNSALARGETASFISRPWNWGCRSATFRCTHLDQPCTQQYLAERNTQSHTWAKSCRFCAVCRFVGRRSSTLPTGVLRNSTFCCCCLLWHILLTAQLWVEWSLEWLWWHSVL